MLSSIVFRGIKKRVANKQNEITVNTSGRLSINQVEKTHQSTLWIAATRRTCDTDIRAGNRQKHRNKLTSVPIAAVVPTKRNGGTSVKFKHKNPIVVVTVVNEIGIRLLFSEYSTESKPTV